MHDPREGHMDVIYQILRYLKSALRKGLIFQKNDHLNIEGYCDSNWVVVLMITHQILHVHRG
jgi:hypothetical protein